MFNMLNNQQRLRKYSPLVCKFLDNLTAISHPCWAGARRGSYVVEQLGFRDTALAAIGLPIALPTLRPALTHFREGKG